MLLHCAIGAVTTGPPVETSAEPEEGCMSTTRLRTGARLAVALVLSLSGCTALTKQVLVDEQGRTVAGARTVSHCSGSQWEDNSMIAIVPIPIIGLGMPTREINEINADEVLSKCGPPERLANRHVEVDRTACVPAVLSRVISLGVWHWCPANVSYEADVTAPEPPQPVASAPPRAAAPRDILSYRPSQ